MAKGIRTIWIDSDSVGVLGTKVYRDDVLIATVPFGTLKYDDPTAEVGVQYKYVTQAYTSDSESTDETLGVNMNYYTIGGSTELMPIMNNFRVNEATPTHVHFDTPLGPISSLSTTDFTISGRTILAVDTTLNYFTVDTAFNYWDNNTIRKEGGNNDVVYDFTLERITNNIPVPTIAPANYRYVAENGSDSADGLTEGTSWLTLKHALQTTPSGGGYQIWVKVGTYLGENIVQADMDNGAEGAPYRITGYKSTIGDITSNYYTLTPNTAYPTLDDTEMPLFDGGDSSAGRFIYNDSRNYYIWENIQVTGYAEAFRSRFSGVQGQQVINSNVKDIGVIASNYGYGVYWVNESNNADRNRVVNTNFMNIESNAIAFDGEFNLAKGCKVYSQNGTTGSEGTDYYYQMESSNNIIKDCLAYNDGNGGHNGHGFSCKTSGSGVDEEVHYNLIDGCEAVAIQGAFQARHANCKFNVWKNSIARADIPNRKEGSSDNYTGCIDFQSGGDQNVFENLTCHDTHQFIRFNLNGEADTDPDIQTNALIKNCLVYDVKNVIDANSVIAGVSAPSGNKLANCTIIGAENMFWQWAGTGSVVFGANKIDNCIIENVPTLNKDEVVVGWTYSYNDFWNTFTTPSGTGNFEVDPELDASYQPQATFTDIDVPKINNVFYGKNGNERQDITTVGAVLSAEEIPGVVVPTVTVSNTDGTADFITIQAAVDSGLVAGDVVGLKGGDEFYGSVLLSTVAGADGNPITFTSYGTGKATLKGSKAISGWVNQGGNIWSASTGGDTAFQVLKDAEPITQARTPVIAGDLARESNFHQVTSTSSSTVFICNELIGLPDLVGATIHIMGYDYVMNDRTVTAFNSGSGQVTISSAVVDGSLSANTEFVINDHANLLTVQDYWHYNSGTLTIYSTTEPTDITISMIEDYGVSLKVASHYLTFDNLIIRDFSSSGIHVHGSNNLTCTNVDFLYNYGTSAESHVFAEAGGTSTVTVDNCIFKGGHSGFLNWQTDTVLTNSEFYNIGVHKYMTSKGYLGHAACTGYSDFIYTTSTITSNTFSNIGYSAINFRGPDSLVDKNYINEHNITFHDGGGIYSYSGESVNSIIEKNTIIVDDANLGDWAVEGIYMDDNTKDVIVRDNNISGHAFAIYLHNSQNIEVTNNKSYLAVNGNIWVRADSGVADGYMIDNVLTYNQALNTNDNVGTRCIITETVYSSNLLMATYDYNVYYATKGNGIGTYMWNNWANYEYATLAEWQAHFVGSDLNSTSNTIPWGVDNKSFFAYNETGVVKDVTLPAGDWDNLTGTITGVSGTITLQPYTSEIMIQIVVSPELITNGDFTDGITGWTLEAGWTIANDKLTYDGAGSNGAQQSTTIENDKTYEVNYEIIDYVSGAVRIGLYGDLKSGLSNGKSGDGVKTETLTVSVTSGYAFTGCRIQSWPSFIGSINIISVIEV